MDDILAKLKSIDDKLLADHPGLAGDRDKLILARTAKVSEEYGELIDEVLSSLGLQRASKISGFDKQNLAKEFGDVFNALILLGVTLDLDIEKTIRGRLDEMLERNGLGTGQN